MALYVAYKVGKGRRLLGRRASQSLNKLRERMREDRGSRWIVAEYDTRWTVERVAQAIEDSTEIEAARIVGEFEIKEEGRVQMRRGSGVDKPRKKRRGEKR